MASGFPVNPSCPSGRPDHPPVREGNFLHQMFVSAFEIYEYLGGYVGRIPVVRPLHYHDNLNNTSVRRLPLRRSDA
eukprot:1195381-Prorocentrum_minimum.AAC.3